MVINMKSNLKNIFINRKTLFFILLIIMFFSFSLTIAYAALGAVLEIHGSSEVVASSWDIHLDNVKVRSDNVSSDPPIITGKSSLSFGVELHQPGDFYEFYVDVVNEGTIDAMIENVIKTPDLTEEQSKFLKYEVTYQNGESIELKQILHKGTSTPIKVRVEFRKDLDVADLPSSSVELNLKLILEYVQSDDSGINILNNGSKLVNVMSGDGTKIGDEVCIKDECFYIISISDENVKLFAKYNLHVGNIVDEDYGVSSLENPTGIQSSTALGKLVDGYPYIGTTAFSSDTQKGTNYSDYSGSIVEIYVNNYKDYLITQGVLPIEARLISKDELVSLGCVAYESCGDKAPVWTHSTSYWTGTARNEDSVWRVFSDGSFDNNRYLYDERFGVRPVIVISRSLI